MGNRKSYPICAVCALNEYSFNLRTTFIFCTCPTCVRKYKSCSMCGDSFNEDLLIRKLKLRLARDAKLREYISILNMMIAVNINCDPDYVNLKIQVIENRYDDINRKLSSNPCRRF